MGLEEKIAGYLFLWPSWPPYLKIASKPLIIKQLKDGQVRWLKMVSKVVKDGQ